LKLSGEYLFNAPIAEVWPALLDPVVLAATMPGCEKLELVNGQYVGDLNIKVGPVQGKFSGKIDLEDVNEPKGYTIKVDGRGAPGFVKATSHVLLEASGSDTKLQYDADASVGGRIASVGQRLLEASAKAIIKQSLEALHETVKARAKRSAAPAAVSVAAAGLRSDEPTASGSSAVARQGESTGAAPEEPVAPADPFVPQPVNQTKFATAVAKEVTKSLIAPAAVWVALAFALLLVVWLVFSRLR
jgi:carbon monoxide dehydrogenase subunit G